MGARRAKNARTRAEVQRAHKDSRMKPDQWERRVGMLLRVNGWEYHRERDRAGGSMNNVRRPGFPDYNCWKTFDRMCDMPDPLLSTLRPILRLPALMDDPFTMFGYIECKTGGGVLTDDQRRWIDAAALCPGVFSRVVYPHDQAGLTDLLGGVEVLR